MKGLILGAGYATRLGELTRDRPKPLLPIAGRPILDYLLDHIEQESDISEVIIVTNTRFAAHFQTWQTAQNRSFSLCILDDGTTSDSNKLGAIGDVRFTIQKLHLDDDLFVIAGDNLFDFDLRPFFAAFAQCGSSVGIYDVKDINLMPRYSEVQMDHDGRILRFIEKPKEPATTFMAIALYAYRREHLPLLESYAREGGNMDSPGHFPAWLCQRAAVYGHIFHGQWYDIGHIEQYQEADAMWRSKQAANQLRDFSLQHSFDRNRAPGEER
ncbi:MAG: nucleotidyltransferase family protein [Chloroflexi bacterium]|nr:nucleotidyltransferase family protein [Chloroflexota bacterium]